MSRKVLICDDAAFMRSLIKRTLSEAGFVVVGEAATGAEAAQQYAALSPDLVTMDIVMPDMGGIDAIREIVKTDPKARILVCSAIGQEGMVDEAMKAGAKDFIVKPFDPEQILDAAEQVLNSEM
jgi:two-component system chemotaxis response regulator CheY